MDILTWILISAIPALGLLAVWLVMRWWGDRHDPMRRTRFDQYSPWSAYGRRSRDDD